MSWRDEEEAALDVAPKGRDRCSACGARIVWILAQRKGKRPAAHPVNPEWVEMVVTGTASSTFLMGYDGGGFLVRGRPALALGETGEITRIRESHFASCPSADRFRGAHRGR